MTRDEISKMSASREMDALIAESVMEWKKDTTNKSGWPNGQFYYSEYFGVERILGTTEDDVKTKRWEPSTNIADAWRVKEKMCGYMLTNPKIYFCFVEKLGAMPNDIIFNLSALKICRAALLAVMEKA